MFFLGVFLKIKYGRSGGGGRLSYVQGKYNITIGS
jgi:hypothetical protein